MAIQTNPCPAAQPSPIRSLHRWLLPALLLASLGIAFWLQPVQAGPPPGNNAPLPQQSASPFAQMGQPGGVSSPLAGQPASLPFTPLSTLPVQVTDFVEALDAFQTAQNLSSSFPSEQVLLPLLGLQVASQPPVITQPNPQSGFPAMVPANRHTVYVPMLSSGVLVAGVSLEAPTPPFSCKSLENFLGSWEYPGQIQCQALLAFYNSTQGDYWLNNDGWLQTRNPCDWYGVGCQAGIGVVSLALNSNGLFGHLPAEIGSLPLRKLNVSDNHLMGTLPDELLAISNWQEISIHSNRFQGGYPISFLPFYDSTRGQTDRRREFTSNRFQRIDTSGYRCTGQGVSVADCEALVAFFRSTGGESPGSLYWTNSTSKWLLDTNPCTWGWLTCAGGRVTSLSFTNSVSQGLIGTLPAELGNLTDLTHLKIEGARLGGSLPAEIGRLSNLRALSIVDSGLSGWLPGELGYLSSLEDLNLAGNRLTGPIPASLGNLKVIQRIDLSRNNLYGEVPSELALVNSGTNVRFHTLALAGNTNLCLPATLNRFVESLLVHHVEPCHPRER